MLFSLSRSMLATALRENKMLIVTPGFNPKIAHVFPLFPQPEVTRKNVVIVTGIVGIEKVMLDEAWQLL